MKKSIIYFLNLICGVGFSYCVSAGVKGAGADCRIHPRVHEEIIPKLYKGKGIQDIYKYMVTCRHAYSSLSKEENTLYPASEFTSFVDRCTANGPKVCLVSQGDISFQKSTYNSQVRDIFKRDSFRKMPQVKVFLEGFLGRGKFNDLSENDKLQIAQALGYLKKKSDTENPPGNLPANPNEAMEVVLNDKALRLLTDNLRVLENSMGRLNLIRKMRASPGNFISRLVQFGETHGSLNNLTAVFKEYLTEEEAKRVLSQVVKGDNLSYIANKKDAISKLDSNLKKMSNRFSEEKVSDILKSNKIGGDFFSNTGLSNMLFSLRGHQLQSEPSEGDDSPLTVAKDQSCTAMSFDEAKRALCFPRDFSQKGTSWSFDDGFSNKGSAAQ